jgi:tetratricopeptide (TPR) repeat protein
MKIAIALFLLFTSLEDVGRQAADLTKDASAQLFRGDVGAAAVMLEKATALYQKVKKPKEEAFAWARLTQVYLALGQYDKASDALQRARTLAGTLDDPLVQAIADSIALTAKATEYGPSSSYLWSFEKDLMFDQFWPFFDDLLVVSADPCVITNSVTCDHMLSSIPMLTERIAFMEGRTLFHAGRLSAARDKWETALATAVSSDMRSAFMAGIGSTYLQEGHKSEAADWFKRAADATEESLQGIKSPESMTSYLGSERRWYYDIAIETLLRNRRTAEAFDYSERSRARAFLQSIGNHRLRAGISNAEYASLTTVAPLRIEDVRKGLPSGTTLISYFVSTYGVRAWIVDADTMLGLALPIDQAALERIINWATRFGSTNARGFTVDEPASQAIGSAEEAFALLFAPLRKHLRNRRLIIIPHGALHYVPFAALRDVGSGCYLIEDYTLMFAPSASALRFIRAKETSIENRALVLGDPTTALGSLPGSAREAQPRIWCMGSRAALIFCTSRRTESTTRTTRSRAGSPLRQAQNTTETSRFTRFCPSSI